MSGSSSIKMGTGTSQQSQTGSSSNIGAGTSQQSPRGSSSNIGPGASLQSQTGGDCECLLLSQAISKPDLPSLKEFLNQRQEAATGWINAFDTPLEKTCSCGRLDIVKKLLLDEMTRLGASEDANYRQRLELDIAAGNGNLETVRTLCEADTTLLDRDNSGCYGLAMLVIRASNAGHGEVTHYLYNTYKTSLLQIWSGDDRYWGPTCLLRDAIFYGFLEIALDIVEKVPCLAPLRFLASKPDLFRSHCDLGFWRNRIYSCMHSEFQTDSKTSRPNRFNRLLWMISQGLPKWCGIKQINELKDKHCRSHRLLKKICKATSGIDKDNVWKETVYEALLEAVENGNKEFFIEIIKCNPLLLWISKGTFGRNLFQLAVEFKKEKIFNLIHGLDDIKVPLLRSTDKENNNILHIAAHLSTPDQLSKISGAALKMQRDAQWFNEVKSLVSEREVVQKNNDKKTPRQIFEKSHEPLRKEGEEWMKYTATACSLVAALIATVTFQAIFTDPGGTDATSGKPLLIGDGHFMAFIMADSLAFFASCISLLIFLSILTSRYSFDDFIVSLPRKMILGLSILFFSVAAMLVAFITALSASMRARPLLVVPMKPLASFPAVLFLMLQYPLLKEMISSTYGKGFFRRDTKNWLCEDIKQGSGKIHNTTAV